MSGIPLLVEGGGLRALVVGGGAVAARKARALAESGARVRVVARTMGAEMLALAGERESLSLETRDYRAGDVGDAELAVAATDDRATNEAIAAEARALHRLVNVADVPGEGSFVTMAAHRSGALVVGVSAGGVPGAAARVRDEIATRFDAPYADALERLIVLRRDLLDRGRGAEWRRLSAALLDESFCAEVESGTFEARLAECR